MKTFPLYRIYRIVWMAICMFAEVFWFEKRGRSAEQWKRLLKKQAAGYKETAVELEGLLIKLGQFLSSRADLLPQVFIDELEGLVDHVPPVPWELARQTLEEQWETPYGDILQKISVEPVASASIGDVYHGYLHTGESVAVKIQRRDVEKIMHTDFKAIRIVVWLMKHLTSLGKRIQLDELYRELVKVTNNELDFRRELRNAQYFRSAFSEDDNVYIPEVYEDYCTKKVLVMEWVDAGKITDRFFLREHGIPPKQLADRVIACFIKQILNMGKFHADPHSGNVFVRKDGTLVLIDYGMVGTVSKSDITYFRMLIEGLLFEDFTKVFDALENLGFLLPSANKRDLEQVIRSVLNFYSNRDIHEIDSTMMEEIMKEVTNVIRHRSIQLPSEFAFLGRAISVLVGLVYRIDPDIDFLESLRPAIRHWMDENDEGWMPSALLGYARNWAKPLSDLPNLARRFLEAPERQLEWEREKQQNEYRHDMYVSGKRYAAVMFFGGMTALFLSVYVERPLLVLGSALFSVIAAVFYIFTAVKHIRWIKNMKGRG